MSSVYKINKGINRPVEFKGLKAQYIWYLGGGVIALLLFFAGLYIIGLPSLASVPLIGILGTVLVLKVYRISRKYGEHGMMKAVARRRMPAAVRWYSRTLFIRKNF